MVTNIQIQNGDFSQADLYQNLAQGTEAGAVVTFVGRMREFTATASPEAKNLWLEHYPVMTEAVLEQIAQQARERWAIIDISIVHRVGELAPGSQIVFVGVSSSHRKEAFAACEFIMDYLKTQAPFWKKEGEHWVKAKHTDQQAAEAWQKPQQ